MLNLTLIHGYVPQNFGHSIIIPLIKDRRGDALQLANYRDIFLSSVFSKLFDVCLSSSFGIFLTSYNLHFGFKINSGCVSAIFVAQQVIQHFNKNGSTVYLSALDASKAFDRDDHNMLVNKLASRGTPWCFIWIIKNWNTKLNAVVGWNGVLNHFFSVVCGVCQGVLFPLMFNVYIDDFIRRLKLDRLGGCVVFTLVVLRMRMTYYFYQHLWHHCKLCLIFVMTKAVSITCCLIPRSLHVL